MMAETGRLTSTVMQAQWQPTALKNHVVPRTLWHSGEALQYFDYGQQVTASG